MSTARRFRFESGNLDKLLAIPKYVLSIVLSWFVPRVANRWVFGSGAGVGEGALAVALELARTRPDARITWITTDEAEAADAERYGFLAVKRRSRHGFWATLRAGHVIVTHGLGDANRFGVVGAFVVQLWHGAPMKRLHFDSSVTTAVGGPAFLRGILEAMYRRGSREVDLYVAGSVTAAERLRSAFRVLPGRVRVLGDPRDDALAWAAIDSDAAEQVSVRVRARLAESTAETVAERTSETTPQIGSRSPLFLYAPTWRDGDPDPEPPSGETLRALEAFLAERDAYLVIRSHPLGEGQWADLAAGSGGRIRLFGADLERDITPLLPAFDALITDYSSIAIDYALLGRPIVWFAPDVDAYTRTRGLYEPLEVTSGGSVTTTWQSALERLVDVTTTDPNPSRANRDARADARALAARFHEHRDGASAARVLAEIDRLTTPARDLIDDRGVFFESFYGRQVSCNPLAIDREIAARYPDLPRYWSVVRETQQVPEGATPLLVGGREWFAARRHAKILVVNDWLRYGFTRRRGQTVLQTWHGTMLKHLALGRPNVGLRTRVAVHRESRRWSLMLSQNPHSTEQFRTSYAFRGRILETGYPRDDRLARAVIGDGRNPVEVQVARRALEIASDAKVLAYVPTWRDRGFTLVDTLDIAALAEDLGSDWTIVARGHTRTHAFGSYRALGAGDAAAKARIIDASEHDDVNDVLLAADLVVTDYSSVMFDATVGRVPLAFFVPDLEAYRDRERGFTFDFEREAPGPVIRDRADIVAWANGADAPAGERDAVRARYDAWRERFNPHDDGSAAARVVDELVAARALPEP